MENIYVKAWTLRMLHRQLERGLFAVPELQREFVWNTRKVCDLLDSIYRKYPIGTILIWKTDRRNENQLRKHYHILPHFNPENQDIYFLIDGQQRLSVLWHLLHGDGGPVVNDAGKKLNFRNILFNSNATQGERLFVYREHLTEELRETHVPVVDLLSDAWRRRVRGHGVRAMRRIEECRRRVLQYEALLVFCETNDRTEVRETFIRINSLGMHVGAADRAFARASEFDMRGLVRDVQSRLKHGFERVSRETILLTFAVALGVRDLGERAISSFVSTLEKNADERARFDRAFPHLREAITFAADYLRFELGVPAFDLLPSEPMLMILALFFYHNGNRRPSRVAKSRLSQWFWATGVLGRYTGRGHRPNLLADAEFAAKLADNPRSRPRVTQRAHIRTLRVTEYGGRGALSRSFLILLRLLGPRYLDDGTAIPLGETSSRRNSSDKHHIFPRALLRKNGIVPEQYNSILNICYLVAHDNRSIGHRSPRSYFAEVPKSSRARTLALRSHLIPSQEGRGIWDCNIKRGFKDLLDDRGRLVAKEFERRAGMRLFDRT